MAEAGVAAPNLGRGTPSAPIMARSGAWGAALADAIKGGILAAHGRALRVRELAAGVSVSRVSAVAAAAADWACCMRGLRRCDCVRLHPGAQQHSVRRVRRLLPE